MRTQSRPEFMSLADGAQVMAYLKQAGEEKNIPLPDLIVLDLHLPLKDGRSVLAELKADSQLKMIPILIFSTSRSRQDVDECYRLGANCYVRKPGNLTDYFAAIRAIDEFWLAYASLPGEHL